jgi:tetratricopeptide (TPR) repeat protein
MKKAIAFLMILVFSVSLAACKRNESDAMQVANAYIDGFMAFHRTGKEYTELGLQLQADYAYGYAAASISSMRYCVDNLLSIQGGGNLEQTVDDRICNWDAIAAMNYSAFYPWVFEGIVHHANGETDKAQACYENAAMNPSFNPDTDTALLLLGMMTENELKALQEKLIKLEEEIYADYTPQATSYPRDAMGYDDGYLRNLAREALKANETDYAGALRHFEAALAVNPYEGGNYAGCALMCLYLNDTDRMYYYVNEGLDADPDHKGLNAFADTLNKGVAK